MTAAQFHRVRRALGLTQAELARRLGVTDRAVRRYEAGDRKIAPPIAQLIEIFVRNHRPQ